MLSWICAMMRSQKTAASEASGPPAELPIRPPSLSVGRFGRLVAIDRRDYALAPLAATRTSRLYRDDYWRGDQGQTPHCVGYSAAHLLAAAPCVQWVDPAGIYQIAQHYDEWPGEDYEGTSVRAAFKVLKMLGYIEAYGFAASVAMARAYVLEHGPIVLGIPWLTGMDKPDKDGTIHASGRTLGGHAILCSGYRSKHFRLLNSWGPGWGDRGHAWLPEDDLRILLDMDGEACTPVEKRLAIPRS